MISYHVEIEEFEAGRRIDGWDVPKTEAHTVETWRDEEGRPHRDSGPAVIVRSVATGEMVGEQWFKHGLGHRDDGPARTAKFWSGATDYAWLQDGKEHRERGPAVLRLSSDPIPLVLKEEWFKAGQRHRIGGPALVHHWEMTGIIDLEMWKVEGKGHRVEGPALIERDETTGVVTSEEWSLDGAYHRDGGPAVTQRDRDSAEIVHKWYYQRGVEIPPP